MMSSHKENTFFMKNSLFFCFVLFFVVLFFFSWVEYGHGLCLHSTAIAGPGKPSFLCLGNADSSIRKDGSNISIIVVNTVCKRNREMVSVKFLAFPLFHQPKSTCYKKISICTCDLTLQRIIWACSALRSAPCKPSRSLRHNQSWYSPKGNKFSVKILSRLKEKEPKTKKEKKKKGSIWVTTF